MFEMQRTYLVISAKKHWGRNLHYVKLVNPHMGAEFNSC